MTKLQEEYESVTTRLQGKPLTLYWHDYAKWLESKLETTHNSDYAVSLSATPKLPSFDDFAYAMKFTYKNKQVLRTAYDTIRKLGNFT